MHIKITKEILKNFPNVSDFGSVNDLMPIEVVALIDLGLGDQWNLSESPCINEMKIYLDDSDIEIDIMPVLSDETKKVIELEVWTQFQKDCIKASSENEDFQDSKENDSEISLNEALENYFDDNENECIRTIQGGDFFN